MKFKLVCSCALFAFTVAATPAQVKNSISGKCGKADVNQFHSAGGMSFVIGELIDAGLVHSDVTTVAGRPPA